MAGDKARNIASSDRAAAMRVVDASALILIAGDILIDTPAGARPLRSPPKRNRNVSSRARNATEKRADTPRRRRRPIAARSGRRAANGARSPGRARARGRALVSLGLFIYCCAKHRARRACDARVSRPMKMESAVDSASTASEVSGSSGGSPRVKAASPARALSPPQLLAPRLPLPPPGLGLLGSLQMMHHSPLELMAAAHHHGPPRYGSPPPISTSDPSANECKLVDYRGQKVAAFIIQGDTMLCLPQAFELFLKHLVGGLHTVYTKLKRLDIVPLVCNVEQVRILRGLGAIQPGVNRCKLLSCKDFDVLYRDCTTARYVRRRPHRLHALILGIISSFYFLYLVFVFKTVLFRFGSNLIL